MWQFCSADKHDKCDNFIWLTNTTNLTILFCWQKRQMWQFHLVDKHDKCDNSIWWTNTANGSFVDIWKLYLVLTNDDKY
jgi:hypothetical protein